MSQHSAAICSEFDLKHLRDSKLLCNEAALCRCFFCITGNSLKSEIAGILKYFARTEGTMCRENVFLESDSELRNGGFLWEK